METSCSQVAAYFIIIQLHTLTKLQGYEIRVCMFRFRQPSQNSADHAWHFIDAVLTVALGGGAALSGRFSFSSLCCAACAVHSPGLRPGSARLLCLMLSVQQPGKGDVAPKSSTSAKREAVWQTTQVQAQQPPALGTHVGVSERIQNDN